MKPYLEKVGIRRMGKGLVIAGLLCGLLVPVAQASAVAAAAAGAGNEATRSSNAAVTRGLVNSPVLGATGYVFVSGVGWRGGVMIYCPPSVGHVLPDRVLRGYANEIENGMCGKLKAITAQQYIDELLGQDVANVVSVAPAVGRFGTFGIIYYRATDK